MSITLSNNLLLCRPHVYMHWCPGCKGRHFIYTNHINRESENKSNWTFDGNNEVPTFNPSIHITHKEPTCSEEELDGILHQREKGIKIDYPHSVTTECHYYLRNGILEYQNDCPHKYRGQSIPLPDFPDLNEYGVYK